jgi:hypothetical protein
VGRDERRDASDMECTLISNSSWFYILPVIFLVEDINKVYINKVVQAAKKSWTMRPSRKHFSI